MSLHLHLPPSHRQDEGLDGDEQDGQVQARIALLAQRAELRPLGHGDRLPPAGPAEQRVFSLGCVDGVEEDHGDDGRNQADEGRCEGEGCVHCDFAAELKTGGC